MEALSEADLRNIRTKYRDRMLYIAYTVSGWSREPEGQRHGAVLAAEGKYVVATGFNGPDRSWQATAWSWRPTRVEGPRLVHAEVNALLNLEMVGVDPSRVICYVTKKPCPDCMAALQEAGVQAVMWLQDLSSADSTWVRGRGAEPDELPLSLNLSA